MALGRRTSFTDSRVATEDGSNPYAGLTIDQAGNLYGATKHGDIGAGEVFQLSPNGDGSWRYSVLVVFDNFGGDGNGGPYASLIFDQAGSLYGTTYEYGDEWPGMVFQLSPNGDGTWKTSVLHCFRCAGDYTDGGYPFAGLSFDGAGNLYGDTSLGGMYAYGTVFQLSPNADGSWTENLLHSFRKHNKGGWRPTSDLVLDAAGNLYGTTSMGGAYGYATVFKLTHVAGVGWKETVLHSFRNRPGAYPQGGLVFDAAGNLYGTTMGDGITTFGSVFEITP